LVKIRFRSSCEIWFRFTLRRCQNVPCWLRVSYVVLLVVLRVLVNPLKPKDPYRCRTAPLTSKRCILYIYSTNICTGYFKHGIYSPFFPLLNAVCFIILTYLIRVLFTFIVQGVLKLKERISAPKD